MEAGAAVGSGTGYRTRENLVGIFRNLLGCGADHDFLLQLDEACLERLIVAVRMRLGK